MESIKVSISTHPKLSFKHQFLTIFNIKHIVFKKFTKPLQKTCRKFTLGNYSSIRQNTT